MQKLSNITRLRLICLFVGVFFSSATFALTFTLPEKGNSVIGHVQKIITEPGDDFNSIARLFDVGYCGLIEANPDIDPENVPPGTMITVPTRFILPNVPREGVIVNLAELRMYYFPKNQNEVWTFPIGIGRQGWLTPLRTTNIVSKKEKPTWVVPKSIQIDRAAQGVQLPDRVLPGPENPLGNYALRLGVGLETYLIHGTNEPKGVGRRSSAGCVRMYPEDIEFLFKHVEVGTPVRVINNAYKVGWNGNTLYLEAHLPLQEQQDGFDNDLTDVVQIILTAAHKNKELVNWDKVECVCNRHSGIPRPIS
jgi:L,D-transpeptidase ErfK/SrfK